MRHKGIVLITLLSLLGLLISFGLAQAQSPEIDSGVGYLTTTQNADGSWGSVSSSTDSLRATAEGVEALAALGLTGDASYTTASTWLGQQDVSITRQFAQRILALSGAGADVQTLSSYIDTLTFAWGGYQGYDINMLDTALAMRALESAGAMDAETLAYAIYYVFTSQNADGGWGFSEGNPSNTYLTALVMETIKPYIQYVDTANALQKAKGYLLAHQNADGGFGNSPSTVYGTAVAYMALVGQTTDETVLGNAINYLKAAQGTDGSWESDPWQTALALQALNLAEDNPAEPEPPVDTTVPPVVTPEDPAPTGDPIPGATSSTLNGQVTDYTTGAPIEGATVTVNGTALSAQTAADGSYTVTGIEQLEFTVTVSADGYLGRTNLPVSTTGYGAYTMDIVMVSSTTSTMSGTVVDAESGQPIAGASVSIEGTSFSTVSGSDGTFSLSGIDVLSFSLSVSAENYISGLYTFQLPGHGLYATEISLLAGSDQSGEPDPEATSTTLSGVVTDSITGAPIAGAIVSVDGTGITTQTLNDGSYTLSGVELYEFGITTSADGYRTQSASVSTEGYGTYTVNLQLASTTATSIYGRIANRETGEPIEGAEVFLYKSGRSVLTAQDGSFTFSDVDAMDGDEMLVDGVPYLEVQFRVSAIGYKGVGGSTLVPAYQASKLNASLIPSDLLGMVVSSVTTEHKSYGAHEEINIDAVFKHTGEKAADAFFALTVLDESGQVVDEFNYDGDVIKFTSGMTKEESFSWNTVQAAPGDYALVVKVLDPAFRSEGLPRGLLVAENAVHITIVPTPIVMGVISLDPAVSQVDLMEPVQIDALLRNTGNVPLDTEYTLKAIYNGTEVYALGSPSTEIAVNDTAKLDMGGFVPQEGGDYIITLSPANNGIQSNMRRVFHVGKHVTASIEIEPAVTFHSVEQVSGTIHLNGVGIQEAKENSPLIPLVQSAIQAGVDKIKNVSTGGCMECHVEPQTMVALSGAKGIAEFDESKITELLNYFANNINPDGSFKGQDTIKSQTMLMLWSLSLYPDSNATSQAILKSSEYILSIQEEDGHWQYDDHRGWWAPPVSFTSVAMIGLSKAYELSGGDPKYVEPLERAARFLLDQENLEEDEYMRKAHRLTGLEAAINIFTDEALKAQALEVIEQDAQLLLSVQNEDGSWSQNSESEGDSLVTAQVLYALYQNGLPGDTKTAENAILYLLSRQDQYGWWRSETGIMTTPYGTTAYVIIALPIAFERLYSIDTTVEMTLADNIEMLSTDRYSNQPDPSTYQWRVLVDDDGEDIHFEIAAAGLKVDEARPIASEAYLTFRSSFSDENVRLPIDIPTITRKGTAAIDVSTDKEVYEKDEEVLIDVKVSNASRQHRDIVANVTVEDLNGNTVQSFESIPLDDMRPAGLVGWPYRIPVVVTPRAKAKAPTGKVYVSYKDALAAMGISDKAIDPDSVKVLEFDDSDHYLADMETSAVYVDDDTLRVTWTMAGENEFGQQRLFYVYFKLMDDHANKGSLIEPGRFIAYVDKSGNLFRIDVNDDGMFGDPALMDSEANRGLAVTDLDGDGFLDIVSGSGSGGKIYLLRNKADGTETFEPRVEIADLYLKKALQDITSADFNNDGKMDIAILNAYPSIGYVLLNQGDGDFITQGFYIIETVLGTDVSDFDLDHNIDIIYGDDSGSIRMQKGDGAGGFVWKKVTNGDSSRDAYGVTTGDFNNDGYDDVIEHATNTVWGVTYSYTVFIAGKGDGTFENKVNLGSIYQKDYVWLDAGDFNNDGNLDLVSASYYGKQVRFYSGNGDATFDTPDVIVSSEEQLQAIAAPQIPPAMNILTGVVEEVPEVRMSFTWNTGTTLAGDYRVHGVLTENGEVVDEDYAHFTILPDAGASSHISTDKIAYSADEDVAIGSSVTNEGSNALLEDLTARISVKSGSDVLYTEDHPVAMMVPGQRVDLKTYWSTADYAKGTYAAVIEVLKGNVQLSTSSATFEILGSANTGEGLLGALTASPELVKRGEDETLLFTVENQGNEDITGLAVRVIVVNPETKEAIETFEATADLSRGTTVVDNFTESTSALGAGVYIAVLEAQTADMAEPRTLAQDTFEVEAPSVEASKAFGTRQQHVLVWLNYNWTSSSEQQTLPDVALVEQSLQAAGVSYVIVYDKKDFQDELRSPFYTDYMILGDHHPLEDHYSSSLREKVFGGRGLISSMFNRQNLDGPVFGVKVTGYLSHGDYPVELGQSDISAEGLMQSAGRSLKAQAQDETQVAAWVVQETKRGALQHPAIVERSYGLGNVLFYAFDLGLSTSNYEQFESLIVNSLAYVHQPEDTTGAFHAYQLVPVGLVLTSTGDDLNVRVEEQYPETFRLFDPSSWSWIEDNPWVLDVFVGEGQETTVGYYALTPDQSGTFTLTSTVGIVDEGEYTYVLDSDIEITVRDTYALTNEALDVVQALTVSPEEETMVADAITLIQGTQSRVVMTADDLETNIHDILLAIEDLLAVTSADTSDAVHLLDDVLKAWEGRAYFVD